jgi:hypothetical protein
MSTWPPVVLPFSHRLGLEERAKMPVCRPFAIAVVSFFALISLEGCRVATDLGRPCTLVKKNPDGGSGSVGILESDLPPNKDFISFGATECEDLVCVRDAAVPRSGIPNATATGYCSRACVPNVTNGCPASNPDDDKDPNKKLSCRALLLDEQTLGAICSTRPDTCQSIGDTRSPYFCARAIPSP